jgi:hypothetical protein
MPDSCHNNGTVPFVTEELMLASRKGVLHEQNSNTKNQAVAGAIDTVLMHWLRPGNEDYRHPNAAWFPAEIVLGRHGSV